MKKRVCLAFVILMLVSFTSYAREDIPEKVLKSLPGQGLSVEQADLPLAVRMILDEQSNYYTALKLQEQERQKQRMLEMLYDTLGAVLVLIIISSITVLILNKKMYKSIKRVMRRAYLYHLIREHIKKGKEFKEIEPLLMEKGFKEIHARDAVIRYKEKHKKEVV